MKTFILTVFSLICFSVTAQVDAFQQDIIDYLNVNGTRTQYNEAYGSMFEVLKQNFETANVPDSVWTELKSDKQESVDEVVSFLTFAYRKYFTQPEIKSLTNFYKSSTAQKMIARKEQLSNAENEMVSNFFGTDVGKKMAAVQSQLTVDVSEISGHWSRDLFAAKMSQLIKKGYSPQQ